MKKPQILLLVLFIIAFVISAFSPYQVNDDGIYRDIEQMNLYHTDNGFAVNTNTSNPVLNSHHLFIKLISFAGTVNPNVLAFIYGLFMLLGMWLIVYSAGDSKYTWTNYALPIILVLIFLDYAYTGYFKSLYVNPFVTVLTALWFGVMLNCYFKGAKWYKIIISSGIAVLFGFSGTVYAFTAVVMGILIVFLMKISKSGFIKILSAVLGIAVIVSTFIFGINYKGADYETNIYNGTFFGIAKFGDVTEIGLDAKLNDLKETFITDEIKEKYDLDNTLYNKVTYGTFVKYYFKHPSKMFKTVDAGAKNAFFKTYENGTFTLYSTAKQTFVPNNYIFILLFWLIFLGFSIFLYKTNKEWQPFLEMCFLLVVMASLTFKIPLIISGAYDITRNLFMLNLIFDITITVIIIGGSRALLKRRDEKKEKFGVTQ